MARYFRRRKFCKFTAEGTKEIDYKDLETLKAYVSETGEDCSKPNNRNKSALPASARDCYQTRALPCFDSLHG